MDNTVFILTTLGVITSFIVTFILGKVAIPILKKFKAKQTILEIGPSWHKSKEGTPTMGGVIFIVAILIVVIEIIRDQPLGSFPLGNTSCGH